MPNEEVRCLTPEEKAIRRRKRCAMDPDLDLEDPKRFSRLIVSRSEEFWTVASEAHMRADDMSLKQRRKAFGSMMKTNSGASMRPRNPRNAEYLALGAMVPATKQGTTPRRRKTS